MMGIGIYELLILAFLPPTLSVVPMWKIFSKAGFPGWLSLSQMVPVLNLIVLFYVAFARWPVQRKASSPYDPIHPS